MDTLNLDTAINKKYLPLFGVLLSVFLFVLAAMRYPGGYDWVNLSISTLFQPDALNGSENEARPFAILAILSFCVSMGAVFKRVSQRATSRLHKKTIEIAGIGSMVYAFLVVTPMHDVLVGVALVFFVVAMLFTLHMVYLERRFWMLFAGVVSLVIPLINAVMYYGNVLYGFLPIVQKMGVFMWAGWLLVLYLEDLSRDAK